MFSLRVITPGLGALALKLLRPLSSSGSLGPLPSFSLAASLAVRRMGIRHFNASTIYRQTQNPDPNHAERTRLRAQEAEREARTKYRNQTATNYVTAFGVFFLALAFGAVPLYRAICKRTGWAGTPITDRASFTPDKVIPVDTQKRIRIQFTCQSLGILPWKFTPLQREVYIVPGETALAFYRAKNMSKDDIIGMATYSVTPDQVAPYFNKIQCFCFEEQRLAAGEEVDMPVFFFIDPEFAKDPAMRSIDDVVLHYLFFKACYLDGELAVAQAEAESEHDSNFTAQQQGSDPTPVSS